MIARHAGLDEQSGNRVIANDGRAGAASDRGGIAEMIVGRVRDEDHVGGVDAFVVAWRDWIVREKRIDDHALLRSFDDEAGGAQERQGGAHVSPCACS